MTKITLEDVNKISTQRRFDILSYFYDEKDHKAYAYRVMKYFNDEMNDPISYKNVRKAIVELETLGFLKTDGNYLAGGNGRPPLKNYILTNKGKIIFKSLREIFKKNE